MNIALLVFSIFVLYISFLSFVNLVGVCKYKDRYITFFEKVIGSSTGDIVKLLISFPYRFLVVFIGKDVGFAEELDKEKGKFAGFYIEHILLFYWILCPILVMAFKPAESIKAEPSSFYIAISFFILMTVNVMADCFSFLWTKRCFWKILNNSNRDLEISGFLLSDFFVATSCFIVTQLISNALYSVQIGDHANWHQYIFNMSIPFKSYAPASSELAGFEFPGQLLISLTSYIPTLLLVLFSLIILMLYPAYTALKSFYKMINLDIHEDCKPVTTIAAFGTLLGVFLQALRQVADALNNLNASNL
ncbi:MAG: hypothetical protein HQL69_23130 [Magnetococcales bacterium]|nr:hypothetical protein [Magnetococcales bacterium]